MHAMHFVAPTPLCLKTERVGSCCTSVGHCGALAAPRAREGELFRSWRGTKGCQYHTPSPHKLKLCRRQLAQAEPSMDGQHQNQAEAAPHRLFRRKSRSVGRRSAWRACEGEPLNFPVGCEADRTRRGHQSAHRHSAWTKPGRAEKWLSCSESLIPLYFT